jgi:hypothetical protein
MIFKKYIIPLPEHIYADIQRIYLAENVFKNNKLKKLTKNTYISKTKTIWFYSNFYITMNY